MRRSAWCLNRFHKQSASGHTPHEMVKGKSFTGTLAAFGGCIMICKPKTNARRKGDSLCEVGVFLGKTENNLFLTGMHGEVRASRSSKRLADDYRGELVEPVKTFPWQINKSVLATKVIPRRVLPGPAHVPALPGNSAPGRVIENGGPGPDEAGSDPPSSEEHESRRNAAAQPSHARRPSRNHTASEPPHEGNVENPAHQSACGSIRRNQAHLNPPLEAFKGRGVGKARENHDNSAKQAAGPSSWRVAGQPRKFQLGWRQSVMHASGTANPLP